MENSKKKKAETSHGLRVDGSWKEWAISNSRIMAASLEEEWLLKSSVSEIVLAESGVTDFAYKALSAMQASDYEIQGAALRLGTTPKILATHLRKLEKRGEYLKPVKLKGVEASDEKSL